MDNVIDISSKRKSENEPLIWHCSCGSTEFKVYNNGDTVCVECEEVQVFPWMDDGDRPA